METVKGLLRAKREAPRETTQNFDKVMAASRARDVWSNDGP
jgi:hypothetical protein